MAEKNPPKITILKVVKQLNGSLFVKFPSMDVLVEMTNAYLDQLLNTGRYKVQWA